MGLRNEIESWFGDDFATVWDEVLASSDEEKEALKLLLDFQQTLANLKQVAVQEQAAMLSNEALREALDTLSGTPSPVVGPWADPENN